MKIEVLAYTPGVDDPKEKIMARVRDALSKLPDLYGNRVLVATAPSPEKVGSIYMTDKAKDEGRWSGKVGLILKLGTTAFRTDPRFPSYEWEGPRPQVGDWIYFRTSDGWEVGLGGISCRHIWDSDCVGRIEDDIECIY